MQEAAIRADVDVDGDGFAEYSMHKGFRSWDTVRRLAGTLIEVPCDVASPFSIATQSVTLSAPTRCLGTPASVRVSQYLSGLGWAGTDFALGTRVGPSPLRHRTRRGAVGASAVHRFWSARFRMRFFTADPAGAHPLCASDPNWTYEGVAYRVNA